MWWFKVYQWYCWVCVSIVTGPRSLTVLGRDVTLEKTCGSIADCTFDELCGRVSVFILFFFFLKTIPSTNLSVLQNKKSVSSVTQKLILNNDFWLCSNHRYPSYTGCILDHLSTGSQSGFGSHAHTHSTPSHTKSTTNQNCSDSKHFSCLFIASAFCFFPPLCTYCPSLCSQTESPSLHLGPIFSSMSKSKSIDNFVNSWARCASYKAARYSNLQRL